ncbi:glucosamine 6-phosphate N-acetyltransferase [Astrocystis sublimbata]|nr:glucosamine 6-phosphate N-acetyltransferase [Astrocystis sublimbata]
MADSPPFLFSPELLSPAVAGLPEEQKRKEEAGFRIRPLRNDDYQRGFYDCLGVLTWCAEPTEAEFRARFKEMQEARDTYFFTIVEFGDRVVGTGCLVAEKKFIHNHGKCGHIEEIAVLKEHQGKGLGLRIMRALETVAKNIGCYKTILNCGPKNEPFYEKCGFHNSGIEMSNYLEEGREGYYRG